MVDGYREIDDCFEVHVKVHVTLPTRKFKNKSWNKGFDIKVDEINLGMLDPMTM